MTPTAQIAAIRQRAENAKEIGAVSVAWSQDIPFLLQQIDARESALRALVAQWKNKAESHRRAAHAYTGFADDNGVRIAQMHRTLADCIDAQAHDVERLLESEQ